MLAFFALGGQRSRVCRLDASRDLLLHRPGSDGHTIRSATISEWPTSSFASRVSPLLFISRRRVLGRSEQGCGEGCGCDKVDHTWRPRLKNPSSHRCPSLAVTRNSASAFALPLFHLPHRLVRVMSPRCESDRSGGQVRSRIPRSSNAPTSQPGQSWSRQGIAWTTAPNTLTAVASQRGYFGTPEACSMHAM